MNQAYHKRKANQYKNNESYKKVNQDCLMNHSELGNQNELMIKNRYFR